MPDRTTRLLLPVAALLLVSACGTADASSSGSGLALPAASAPAASASSTPSSPSPGSTLQVVGLGDSVTSGYHCDRDDYVTGFAHLLAEQDGIKVDATDDDEAGSTSDGLADELEGTDDDDRDLQDDVARDAERSGYLAWSDAVTRQADTAIATVASAHRATLVDLDAPFKGDGSGDPTSLLADDGDHPGAAGTALISRAVLQAYEAHRAGAASGLGPASNRRRPQALGSRRSVTTGTPASSTPSATTRKPKRR